MNIFIILNGADVTDACLLRETRISYDSTRRITTANLTLMGAALGKAARYDYAHYDQDIYALDLKELYLVTILDGRDRSKLFEGQIFAFSLVQSDAPTFDVFYKCDLNDHSAWLDRSVCWDSSFSLPMPTSDQTIIKALLGRFCTKIDATQDVADIVPAIQKYDWTTKTCRQVLDDMATLSGGEWHVDFNGVLHYGLESNAPQAPYGLSTSPDLVSTFPVLVSNYKHDFNTPINRCYVRGSLDVSAGVAVQASYADPISIGTYGEYASAVVDPQIMTGYDASLRAKSVVLKYAYPIESGNFTVWGMDWLKLGQQVSIVEENLGVNGWYIIRQLTMQWEDKTTVRYDAQFGATQPDLETVLRLLAQRSAWSSAMAVSSTSIPAPGSVTDASIASPGLSASSIQSVNASVILGQIIAHQIASVNAGAIVGTLNASQIGGVNAGSIQGVINAGQIGSVNAATIQGVVVSSQLANNIIDDLAKYADRLRPVPMLSTPPVLPNADLPANSFFYYIPDGHFYQIGASGLSYSRNDSPQNSLLNFYHIGAISANSIIGLILAAQIQSITAGQITGQIQASQIATVNASAISGTINASQIGGVNASTIQGTITATQIASVNAGSIQGTINSTQIASVTAGQISGTLSYNQIGSVNAATITIGQIQDNQIGTISGAKLNIGSVTSDKFDGYSINVGGGGNKPGRINVYDGFQSVVAQMGIVDSGGVYGGWFKAFAVGGSGWNDAKLKGDTSGNLSITDSSLTITNPNTATQISTGPSVWDSSYSSISLDIKGGSDWTQHITRGIVINYGGSKVAAFVRSPNGGFAALEIAASGRPYMLLDGTDGTVRADGGYRVGSNAGATGTFRDQAGNTIRVAGGIIYGFS